MDLYKFYREEKCLTNEKGPQGLFCICTTCGIDTFSYKILKDETTIISNLNDYWGHFTGDARL